MGQAHETDRHVREEAREETGVEITANGRINVKRLTATMIHLGIAKGSSISWVAKLQGDNNFRMHAVRCVVVKLQGDKTEIITAGIEWS